MYATNNQSLFLLNKSELSWLLKHASADRGNLSKLYFDTSNACVIATDGNRLAIRRARSEASGPAFALSYEAVKSIQAAMRRDQLVAFERTEAGVIASVMNDVSLPPVLKSFAESCDEVFVPYREVLKKLKPGYSESGLLYIDGRLLQEAADLRKFMKGSNQIELLTTGDGIYAPVVLSANGDDADYLAVVMPMRHEGEAIGMSILQLVCDDTVEQLPIAGETRDEPRACRGLV